MAQGKQWDLTNAPQMTSRPEHQRVEKYTVRLAASMSALPLTTLLTTCTAVKRSEMGSEIAMGALFLAPFGLGTLEKPQRTTQCLVLQY